MPVCLTFTFPGTCEDAMALYAKAFGAKTNALLRYKDAQLEDMLPVDKQFEHLIYHAEMDICGARAMLSDEIIEHAPTGIPPLSLTVTLPTPNAVREAFRALRPGGSVLRAMRMTTFSACVVTLIDRFGVKWGLMTESAPEFLVRDARAQDAPALARLAGASISAACEDSETPEARREWAASFVKRVEKEVEKGGYTGLALEYNGEMRGMMLCAPGRTAESVEICAFYLDRRIWGIGVGRYLMDAAVALFHRNGYARARLWAPAEDMRARFFFDDCGFSLTGEERATHVNADGRALDYCEVRYELEIAEYTA